jgi:hypothetical protein
MSDARRHSRRALKAIMRSYNFKLPKYDLPIRIRPVSNTHLTRWLSTDQKVTLSPS